MQKTEILNLIREECNAVPDTSAATDGVARRVYSKLPADDGELVDLLDFLVSTGESRMLWFASVWIKRRGLYRLEYMPTYEGWLHDHVTRWGICDVFCYRVLNPMLERHPQLFKRVMAWADSPKTYVRRAAPVSLLVSGQSFRVNSSLDRVLAIVRKLKHDEEDHVQKGVGWLLKYAYLTYPEEIHQYLKENVDNLPRLIFRYALEKAPEEVRKELMSL